MKNLFITTLVLIIAASSTFAQFGSVGAVEARSMGMAKTYNATSRGVMSIGINPANLIYNKPNDFELATVLPLPMVTLRSGTDFMSIDEVNYYFGGVDGKARILTADDKKNFNDLFKDGGFIFMNIATRLLTVSYNSTPDIGAFAFSINDVVGGKFYFPQALVDIALTGNPTGKTYDFNDADGKAWWLRNYSLSYAREIPEIPQSIFDKIGAGITLKLVQGFAYAGVEHSNTNLTTGTGNAITGTADFLSYTAFSEDFGVKYDFDSVETKSNMGLFPSTAGSGFGIDIGFTAAMDKWNFALAITDIGSITWKNHTAQFSATGDLYIDDFTDQDQLDTLKEKITGKAAPIGEFSTSLATAFRMGASYMFDVEDDVIPGTLLLALDYNQGFNDLPGNSKSPRFSIGTEWKPMDYIPYVRMGFSFGGADGFNWGFGLGFDAGIVEFNLATSDFQAFVAPNSAKYISVAMGSRWKF